jgi:hypothetical protein
MSFASNVSDFRCLANEQPNVVTCTKKKNTNKFGMALQKEQENNLTK